MQKLVASHACALGVPEEYVFFPLLSCVAGAMGHAQVLVNEEWRERCAIWCAVVGRRGSRRSAALNRFAAAASSMARNSGSPGPAHNGRIDDGMAHQLRPMHCVPELLRDFKDDIHVNTLLHEDLDEVVTFLLKESGLNRHRLKKLYDVDCEAGMSSSCLNVAGFVPAENAYSFLENNNIDLASRFLVTCPPEVLFYNKDLKVPMPSNTPPLQDILEVLWLRHSDPQMYVMRGPAKALFCQYYDRYMDMLREIGQDDAGYGHVAKAPGQLARLSSVLCALRQALKYVVYREDVAHGSWNFEIGQEDVEASKIIVDQVLRTKFSIIESKDTAAGQVVRDQATLQDHRDLVGQLKTNPIPQVPTTPAPAPQIQEPARLPENNIQPTGAKRQRLSTESPHEASPVASTSSEERQDVARPTENGAQYNAQYVAASYAAHQLNTLLKAAAIQRSQLQAAQAQQAAGYHPGTEVQGRQNLPEYETANTQVGLPSVTSLWASTANAAATTAQHMPTQVEGVNRLPIPPSMPQTGMVQANMGHQMTTTTSVNSVQPIQAALAQQAQQQMSPQPNMDTTKLEDGLRAFFFRNQTDQPLGLFEEEPEKFVEEHGPKLKKLLEFRMDYRISPSTCAQRHLIPPLSRRDMLKYDTQTKYPVQVAKEFLLKVAELGFGSIETVIHPANKRRSSFFQKFAYETLGNEPKLILQKLNISEAEYMAAFLPNGGRDQVYGFPFAQSPQVPSMVPISGSGGSGTPQFPMPSPSAEENSNEASSQAVPMSTPKTEPRDVHDSDDSQL